MVEKAALLGASYKSISSGARVEAACYLRFHGCLEGVATRRPGAKEEIVGSQEVGKIHCLHCGDLLECSKKGVSS